MTDKYHQFQKDMTAAVENITGTFTCSNNRHKATGQKFTVNGRTLCKRCKELRDHHNAIAMRARKQRLA
jgi:hypothetical protein